MSYGLQLWRQTGTLTLGWDELWDAFEAGETLPFVAPLRSEEIVSTLRRYFPTIDASEHEINWEGDGSYFQLNFSHQAERQVSSILFSCGFSLPPKTLARFFDFAWEMKLSVYDGQGPTFFVPIGSPCRPASWWERVLRKKWQTQRA